MILAAGIFPPLHWLAHGHMTSNKYETVYRHTPWAGNIAKKLSWCTLETVHCHPQNFEHCCTWSECVVEGGLILLSLESQLVFQNLLFFCFAIYNKSLYDRSLGERWILFPSNLNVSWDERFLGTEINCPPRDQSLSVKCYSMTGFKFISN